MRGDAHLPWNEGLFFVEHACGVVLVVYFHSVIPLTVCLGGREMVLGDVAVVGVTLLCAHDTQLLGSRECGQEYVVAFLVELAAGWAGNGSSSGLDWRPFFPFMRQ